MKVTRKSKRKTKDKIVKPKSGFFGALFNQVKRVYHDIN